MFTIDKAGLSRFPASPPLALPDRSGAMAPMKILVVDDHCLIREALCDLLKELANNAIILEAANGQQAVAFASEQADIDLVLLDLNLPDRDGFAVLAGIRGHNPAASVVVLLDRPDRAAAVRALNLGALGVVPKSEQRQIILGALQLIFAGGVYIPHNILTHNSSPTKSADISLTGRQRNVLALMMQGKSNKAICRALDLAVPTVKNHITAILRVLNVTNRTEAVIAAGALGWQPPLSNRSHQALQYAMAH